MKKLLLVLSALCVSLQLPGQGFIAFNNYGSGGSPFAPVYGSEVNNPQQQKWGNAAEAYPAGTQTYSGAPLTGPNYSVEGWYSLMPVTDVFALNSGASMVSQSLTTFLPTGVFFSAGNSFIPEVTPSTNPLGVYLQVRAWDNGGGQYGSWNDAWNAAQARSGRAVGWSKVFWQPVVTGLPPVPGLYNFESFNIYVVPEPSTFVLIGLGGLALLLFRRRTRA